VILYFQYYTEVSKIYNYSCLMYISWDRTEMRNLYEISAVCVSVDCCTAFNFVLIWCEWQCSDISHTDFSRGKFIASGDLSIEFCVAGIFATFTMHHLHCYRILGSPLDHRISSLITGRIWFATTSADLCATDGLVLKCLLIWDRASSRNSRHGTHPGRSWNHLTLQCF